MGTTGEIIIRIEGKYGDENLSPLNFDILQLKELLEYIAKLIQPDKQKDGPPISLVSIEEGSVKNVFRASVDNVAQVATILSLLSTSQSLDVLDANKVKALESLREYTITHNFSKLSISTPEQGGSFSITPETKFKYSDEVLVDVEKYIYGKIVDAGGKGEATIHIDTEEGVLVVKTDKECIGSIKDNPLYKDYCLRVTAKQNLHTGELIKGTLKLVEIIDYSPVYDEEYANSIINKSTPTWRGVDADKYVRSIREGTYEG